MRDRLSVLAVICLCVFVPACSPPAATNAVPKAAEKAELPEAKTLFRKYADALGGKEAMEELKSRVAKGTVELPTMGLKGTYELTAKAPDKMLISIDIPTFGKLLDGFDGARGWEENPAEGIRIKEGDELKGLKRDSDFYLDVNLEKYYPNAKVTGIEPHGGSLLYVVKADEGTTFYFDGKTDLLVRTDIVASTSEGTVRAQTYLGDYRETDGIRQPFSVRQVRSGMELQYKVSEMKFNVDIDDSKFAPPEK